MCTINKKIQSINSVLGSHFLKGRKERKKERGRERLDIGKREYKTSYNSKLRKKHMKLLKKKIGKMITRE